LASLARIVVSGGLCRDAEIAIERGMKTPSLFFVAAAALAVLPGARSEVRPNALFSDHAVLQQGREIPVWGTGTDGERVTIAIAGRTAATTTQGGHWLVRLPPLPAGGPYTLTVSGPSNTVEAVDILVGEVWLCSGQSNMERQLGPREGQPLIANWEAEAAAANYPEIRHFLVPQKTALAPAAAVEGEWIVCSPRTVADFTAVGYFFGRDLFQARHVPVGLIHSSWGGTPAESWTSLDTLRTLPDFAQTVAEINATRFEIQNGTYDYQKKLAGWFQAHDPGSAQVAPWSAPDLDTAGWTATNLPAAWEDAGMPGFDGVVWFRKSFDLPEAWAGTDAELQLGAIDDADTTWVNGVQVGATSGWRVPRVYAVPAAVLHAGRNVIAVRVLDTGGHGGIWGGGHPLQLVPATGHAGATIPLARAAAAGLAGEWLRQPSVRLGPVPHPPADYRTSAQVPGSLYHGMIAPLQPCAIRGVIWYQGETNVGRERQYRTLFPTLIADWRRAWGAGDFPFLFVQIAPHKDMTPEIREAQLLTLERTPNTAMAVTIDCGDANNIHPAHKQPVGARLALAARALAYGEKIEYSGPAFAAMQVAGNRVVLHFTHLGGGLVAKDGPLVGFTIAGADKVCHPAKAEIQGDAIVVSADAVAQPVAVRYGWANVPEGNLYNAAGLPASPFRTDVD
jgi:sialate O-acetylesterase